jgi:TPR repeat protein
MPVFLDFDADTARKKDMGTLLKGALKDATPEMREALGLSRMLDAEVKWDSATFSAIVAAAGAGSPEALALLGRKYEQGIEAERDRVRAAMYYARAIRMDSPRAGQLLWDLMKEEGFFLELKSRAGRHDPAALFVWPALLALGFDGPMMQNGATITPKQALQFLQDGASLGDPSSMIELGLCHYAGRWVSRDPEKASEWWSAAARLGSVEAKVRLAVAQVREREDEAPLAEAVAVLDRASAGGSVLAEVALAYCFENGRGVAERLPEAVRLYRVAAARGSQDAYRSLRRLHDDIRPGDKIFQIPD